MNHDTPHPQTDPRITAYALGELPETEKKEIEDLLLQHPEFQAELDEIRQLGTLLTEALEHEPILETGKMPLPLRKKRRILPLLTVAASFLLLLAGGIFFLTHPFGGEEPGSVYLSQLPHSPCISETSDPQNEETTAFDAVAFDQKENGVSEDVLEIMENAMPVPAEGENPDVEMAEEFLREETVATPPAAPMPNVHTAEKQKNAVALKAGGQTSSNVLAKERRSMESFSRRMNPPNIVIPPPILPEKPAPVENHNSYTAREENGFQNPAEVPFSTFGIDVDTASYTVARQYLTEQKVLPPPEAIRVEEFLQYFDYDFPQPQPEEKCPIATTVEIHPHPWQDGLLMAQVSLQGRKIPQEKRPPMNLVFLLDVSGSMSDWNKLPLVKDGMMKLLEQLTENDRVAIVTYADDAKMHLPSTSGSERQTLEKAILQLHASGSTAGSRGLELAYETARKNFNKEAVNRIIFCSDGDFNVGRTDNDELEKQIAREAKSGIFLTVLGFGMGNYHDDRLKILASHGNGNYGYVDSRSEAQRLLCDEFCGTLLTIAKDVKLQIEFNPQHVAAYRLIGFEHRKLEDRDFHNDRKDSGDMGAGHSVTALYELVPHGVAVPDGGNVDTPRYAAVEKEQGKEPSPEVQPTTTRETSPEWMFVKLRYKLPEEKESSLVEIPFPYHPESKTEPGRNFRLATSVALFALLLRQSEYTANAHWDTVQKLLAEVSPKNTKEQELEKLVKLAQEFD
ncbi:MAG: von Willebrand factor type A domain-containing protein [Planctomycetia bacterium]|nr:von Willebrand factor type A domain-containing protein [Planctomycetia bacterium]